jgi:hypothetical protein
VKTEEKERKGNVKYRPEMIPTENIKITKLIQSACNFLNNMTNSYNTKQLKDTISKHTCCAWIETEINSLTLSKMCSNFNFNMRQIYESHSSGGCILHKELKRESKHTKKCKLQQNNQKRFFQVEP